MLIIASGPLKVIMVNTQAGSQRGQIPHDGRRREGKPGPSGSYNRIHPSREGIITLISEGSKPPQTPIPLARDLGVTSNTVAQQPLYKNNSNKIKDLASLTMEEL
jgi:hypothetical protein